MGEIDLLRKRRWPLKNGETQDTTTLRFSFSLPLLAWQHSTQLLYFPSSGERTIFVSSSPEPTIERAPHPPLEHLQGIVERVTYHADDSGYTVARLKAPGERDLITILGRFPDIHAGQTLRLAGHWSEHPKYGRQFQMVSAQETKPATL